MGWPLQRLAERGVKELLAAREVDGGVEAYYATRGSIEGPDTVRRATNFGSAPREATVAAAASVDIPHQAVVFDGPTAHVATFADGIQVSHLVAGRWRTNTLATNLGSNVLTPLFGFAVGADLPMLCYGRTQQSVGRLLCAEPIDGVWRESQVDFADNAGTVAVSRTGAGTFVALVHRFSQTLMVAREGAQGEWSTVELDGGLDDTVPPIFVAGESGVVLVAREVTLARRL